jgi:hypothetical protein
MPKVATRELWLRSEGAERDGDQRGEPGGTVPPFSGGVELRRGVARALCAELGETSAKIAAGFGERTFED